MPLLTKSQSFRESQTGDVYANLYTTAPTDLTVIYFYRVFNLSYRQYRMSWGCNRIPI